MEELPLSGGPSTSAIEVNIAKVKEIVTELNILSVVDFFYIKVAQLIYLMKEFFAGELCESYVIKNEG